MYIENEPLGAVFGAWIIMVILGIGFALLLLWLFG